MRFQFDTARWYEDERGVWLCLCLPRNLKQRVREFVDKLDKMFTAELKRWRKPRSLDANAYLWVLLDKLADALNSTKDEIYTEMLLRYGVFTHVCVKPHMAERVMQEWRAARSLGEIEINGKPSVQLQCYFGSSTYDTAEMSKLLRGVVSECQLLGIETATPAELAALEAAWGR